MKKRFLMLLAAALLLLVLPGCDLENGSAQEQVACSGDADMNANPDKTLTGTTKDGTYVPFADFLGKSSLEITLKYILAYNHWFNTVYREVPGDSTMAYILDDYSDEIRSEGMSYGMMIFVQMNDSTRFAKLWKLAKNKMQFGANDKFGGFFHWRLYGSGDKFLQKKGSIGMASDGELYMAAALIMAYNRWGITQYKTDATDLILKMINYSSSDNNETSFFYSNYYVKHWPENASTTVTTNPSYHLPAFFQQFISFLPSTYQSAKLKYANIRDASRAFLKKCLEKSTYRLPPDVSDTNGVGKNWGNDGKEFAHDAWRVAMNITLDADWYGTQTYGKTWLEDYARKFCDFFESKNSSGKRDYKDQWYTDGTKYKVQDGHKLGHVAMNAMVACLIPDYMGMKSMQAKRYMQELWDINVNSTDQSYRNKYSLDNYYNVCLYTFAMLWATGHYRVY
ncbi:MAG: hypothetical protein JW874_10350 [Spirochaetales bacterium]|nr:hypothetical protein [Spirochaetales bacterium]